MKGIVFEWGENTLKELFTFSFLLEYLVMELFFFTFLVQSAIICLYRNFLTFPFAFP